VIFSAVSAAGLGLGSGSLTPPPAVAGLGAAGGLGLFGGAGQRFSTAPGADRAFGHSAAALAAIYAAANAGRNGVNPLGFGSNQNMFNNPKSRHNSIDRASSNRSVLLEDFRYLKIFFNTIIREKKERKVRRQSTMKKNVEL
jgi:hypothetical protein